MPNKDKNIPKRRFKEFENADAWELRRIFEIADRFDNLRIPIASSLRVPGRTPYYGANGIQDYVEGYTHDGEFVLVAEDGANDLKNYPVNLVNGKIWVNNHAHVLQGKENIANNNFLSYSINRANIEVLLVGGGRAKLNSDVLMDIELEIPSLPEQETIGTFFSTLDQHIALHQRKLDTLKEQKKTYLKLLFPVKGQTKPALRFQGFEDDWEEVKLGELCDIRTGKLDANAMVENGKYDFYTSGIKKYKIDVAEFEGPAITIAGNGATVGYMHLADGKFNAYQRTYVLTNFKVDRSYIFSEVAEKLPMKIQQEARTGNIPYIVLSMLTELSISLPSLPEQEAIGTFFRTLDQEIAQVEAKLASLKEMKKTLLRKLFV